MTLATPAQRNEDLAGPAAISIAEARIARSSRVVLEVECCAWGLASPPSWGRTARASRPCCTPSTACSPVVGQRGGVRAATDRCPPAHRLRAAGPVGRAPAPRDRTRVVSLGRAAALGPFRRFRPADRAAVATAAVGIRGWRVVTPATGSPHLRLHLERQLLSLRVQTLRGTPYSP